MLNLELLGNIGVLSGKFLPPHRGHLRAMIDAATRVKKLYVVVSGSDEITMNLCSDIILPGRPIMDLRTRAKWISQELQNFDHIKVLMLDETGMPNYPDGWEPWSKKLLEIIPEHHIDVLFGGEQEYKDVNEKWFPGTRYEIFDKGRTLFPISGTKIRNDAMANWDYILGAARPYFAKRVLIAGSESAGKTTVTKYLAKLYYTSWAEEEGRYYSAKYLGGNEDVFTAEDFEKIAQLQYDIDMKALKSANKVVFFDTSAVETQFYCKKYLDVYNPAIERWVDPNRYDIVLFFSPDVPWVDDGIRFLGDQDVRNNNNNELLKMYKERGFRNIIEISGSYNKRLCRAIAEVEKIIK